MRSVSNRIAIAALVSVFVGMSWLGREAFAQESWNTTVPIVRKQKPTHAPIKRKTRRIVRRRPNKPPIVEEVTEPEVARLLAVQWRILKLDPNGAQTEVSANTVFNPGDRLRLAVKTNQDGYLYVIHQASAGQPGEVLFPQSNINNGQNLVKGETEFVVPSNCTVGATAAADCAYVVNGSGTPENFMVIFSRSAFLNLPNDAREASGGIKPTVLMELLRSSREIPVKPLPGDTPFSVRLINPNPKDNEELVVPYVLYKKSERSSN